KLAALRDPCAVLAYFHGGNSAVFGESAREGFVGSVVLEKGACLVLVREYRVHALFQLSEDPVAGDVHDFERSHVDADGAAGGASGLDDGVGERGVEHEVTLDVRVAAAFEIGAGNF